MVLCILRKAGETVGTYCINPLVVKKGLCTLAGIKAHPLVGLFLDISRYYTENNISREKTVDANISQLCKDYSLEGGPVNRPNLIPFKDRNTQGPVGFFRGRNIAGSYARSSVREDSSQITLFDGKDKYRLPADVQAFFSVRMPGERLKVWAIGAYYLRNAIFSFPDSHEPGAGELVDIFEKVYGLSGLPVLDEDVSDCPTPVFLNADRIQGKVSPQTVSLWDGESVKVFLRARRPALIASDIIDGIEDPRDHSRIDAVSRMLHEFGGAILVGPPGTSKSFLAQQVADTLTEGDEGRQFYVQFHSSYQYEDFIEGYRPTDQGGFERKEGIFLRACHVAGKSEDGPVILIIDEISRADVGRVFGEALTYIEVSKRNESFFLPSGETAAVPSNLLILGTMNSLDRGANDIDEAFGRRFAFFEVPPDPACLKSVLSKDADDDLLSRITRWLEADLEIAKSEPRAAVGHAFFAGIRNEYDARRRWNYQLKRYLSHALYGRPDIMSELEELWEGEFPPIEDVL